MKVLQIGAGGIGSYLARELSNLIVQDVKGTEDLEITVIDGDEVEEKNLRYQNFPEPEDLEESKAKVIGERYNLHHKHKYVESEDELKGFDIILLAVDNGKARNLVYEYCDKTGTKFIDMRSEGRQVAFYTTHKSNTLEKLKSTIDVDKPSTSCQISYELEAGLIQQGNKIIASIGSQLLMNEIRGEKNIPEWVQRF